MNQEEGRVIKGSAIMGFSLDPQKCLDKAAGDLRHMGCAIFYKRCQEVNTIARQILLGAPNTIEEESIKQTLDDELERVEQKLLSDNNIKYKITKQQQSWWLNYAVVCKFPAGMSCEGAEEKKQKQGTNNARLAYGLHLHAPDYERMRMLLAYSKDYKVWHKHWGNSAFTVEISTEKSTQAEKKRYIHMVQMHRSVQLSMGAALLEGLINVDTTFTLWLLVDAEGKTRPPTTTSVREILSLMELNDKKVWICVSTGSNGMSMGYFLSVLQEISEHVAAFIASPGAQVYWWLRRQECITVDVNKLIRHCFTLSQQQKVLSSKYLKDLGHTVVDRTDGNDIIHTSNLEGIYDLSLGLSDKERGSLVALRGYDAAAITYGKAKEGAIEAYNFSAALSVTSLHSAREKGAEEGPGPTPTLAQLVYSIGTSRVTKESDDGSNGEEGNNMKEGNSYHQQVAINGMDIVRGNGKGAMLFSTASMEETSVQASKDKRKMEEDFAEAEKSTSTNEYELQDEEREEAYLTAKMNEATAQINLGLEDEEGSDLQENNMNICSGNLNLNIKDYSSNAKEVLFGEFNAAYVKKYANPKTFLYALWNAAGPSAGAMVTCLNIIKDELEGELAGVPAEFRNLPEELTNFMYKEAGTDIRDVIKFISDVSNQLNQFDEDEREEDSKGHVKVITYNEDAPVESNLGIITGGTQEGASKTQGTLPGAHQTGPAEGTVNKPATEAGGDKERVQSMSMGTSG